MLVGPATVSTALVIGGAGFIGSHLVERLLDDGVAVDVVDDLSSGSLGNLGAARAMAGSLKIHHLDGGAAEAASLIGMRRPDVVYHLAAIPRSDPDARSLGAAFARSMSIVEAARHHRIAKIVTAIPASAIYGRPASKDVPLKERPLEPRGVRGVVARATIDLLEAARDLDAIEFTALALGTVYGPRQRPSGGVVAAFAEAARTSTPATIRGDGRQTRDFVFVEDVAAANLAAAQAPDAAGAVVNIGSGERRTLNDLIAVLHDLTGEHTPPRYTAAQPGDVKHSQADISLARRIIGYEPQVDFAEGIRRTCEWYGSRRSG